MSLNADPRPRRVLMVGAYDPDYPRHAILKAGLQAAGIEVIERRLPPQATTRERFGLLMRSRQALSRCDAMLLPAFNQVIAPAAGALARLAGKPLLVDYMVGLADVDVDRGTVGARRAALHRAIDRYNLRHFAMMTDTDAHRWAFARLLDVPVERLHVVPVGARAEWLDAAPVPTRAAGDPLVVGWVGTYIPFQGVAVILEAAALLRDDPSIRFELIGRGQTYAQSIELARVLNLANVTFLNEFYSLPQLLPRLARSTILLGVFGATEKTDYVVPNKVYDGLAFGRPVITAEAAALREFFTPGEHLITVPPGDAAALAAAIRALASDPDRIQALGAAGVRRIREAFLPAHIGERVAAIFDRLTQRLDHI